MEWISVEDDRPKIEEEVNFIIYSPNDLYNNIVTTGLYMGVFHGLYSFYSCKLNLVIAGKLWMPLPEPPIENKCIICKGDENNIGNLAEEEIEKLIKKEIIGPVCEKCSKIFQREYVQEVIF